MYQQSGPGLFTEIDWDLQQAMRGRRVEEMVTNHN